MAMVDKIMANLHIAPKKRGGPYGVSGLDGTLGELVLGNGASQPESTVKVTP